MYKYPGTAFVVIGSWELGDMEDSNSNSSKRSLEASMDLLLLRRIKRMIIATNKTMATIVPTTANTVRMSVRALIDRHWETE